MQHRPKLESPVMDRDLALALLVAALAAVVLTVMQIGSTFESRATVAAFDPASQPRSANPAEEFGRRLR